MTETQDFETPTVSERAAVLRERAAFYRGAFEAETSNGGMHQDSLRAAAYRRTAAERYPIPKRQRPLRVTLSNGSTWSMVCDGKMVCHGPGHKNDPTRYPAVIETWRAASNLATAEDFEKFARCLHGELEDVPDDE